MELYRKKVNLGGKPNQDTSYTTSQRPRNIYLQKMIKKIQSKTRLSKAA